MIAGIYQKPHLCVSYYIELGRPSIKAAPKKLKVK